MVKAVMKRGQFWPVQDGGTFDNDFDMSECKGKRIGYMALFALEWYGEFIHFLRQI